MRPGRTVDDGRPVHKSRGLCVRCYAWVRYNEDLLDYERKNEPFDWYFDDVRLMRAEGRSWESIGVELGKKPATVRRGWERYLARQRRDAA